MEYRLRSDSISDIQKNSSIINYGTTIISELSNDSKFNTHESVQSIAFRSRGRMKKKKH